MLQYHHQQPNLNYAGEKIMDPKTMSGNACRAFMRASIPLSFNNVKHYLGFESFAYSDVIRVKYRFYSFKGLYWFSVVMSDGHVMNSFPFVSLSNCVRDFRSFCASLQWTIEQSSALAKFVARYNSNSTCRS